VPEAKDTAVVESNTARPAPVVTLRTLPNPVGRVRKFWGEFF
jgi:hypothetical protein